MRIRVNIACNKLTFVMDVDETTDTVEDIKELISHNFGIAVTCQSIVLPGYELKEEEPLSTYNIKDGTMFYLILKVGKVMLVYICSEEEACPVEVVEPYYVHEAKSTFHDMRGHAPERQRLFFNGEELEDDRKLPEYGIEAGAEIAFILEPTEEDDSPVPRFGRKSQGETAPSS